MKLFCCQGLFAVTGFVLLFCLECYGYTFLKPIMIGEGECIDDDWEIHPIGTVWFDYENCEKLECIFHKRVLYAKGYGCSTVGVPEGCKLVRGNGRKYPYCCPRVKCKNGNK